MSSLAVSSRAWIAGASVGLVEAMKDQGFARWNYTIRSIHHRAKSNIASLSQTKRLSSPSSSSSAAAAAGSVVVSSREEKVKQSEESLRTVMYLSCWGPN